MAFEIPKQPYSGKIGQTTIGTGAGAVTVGGQDTYAFHLFEGKMPNAPKIAMEVWDYDPSQEWPAAVIEPFKEVISSPDMWAKKCVSQYGADVIVLHLKSTDPNGMDRSAVEAVQVVKKVLDAVSVPLVVMGTANNQKDEEVLKKVSEVCEGKNVTLGPVEEGNHKAIGASALGYGHTIVASTPIDVNLAKQLNILLGNLGVQSEKVIIDPTTGGLGYGMEYTYSVMERIMMAALTQEDERLMLPMMNNIGNEVWKCKEAKLSADDAPTLGDAEKRPILMEAVAAVTYLMAGSNLLILRHPESVRLVRSFIQRMTEGGSAADIQGIAKRLLDGPTIDLSNFSPKPSLDFGAPDGEKKEKPKANKEPAPKPNEAAVPVRVAPEVEKPSAEDTNTKRDSEAKAGAMAEEKAGAKDKADAEAETKAGAAAKTKAESDALTSVKAEEEAQNKVEVDARAKREAEEAELRLNRAAEREKLTAEHTHQEGGKKIAMNAAKKQKDELEKIIDRLNRIHRRIPLY